MSRKRCKHRYEFTMHVHDLKLPVSFSSRLAVSCSRGTTMVATDFAKAVDGKVSWNSELRLETPMYFDVKSGTYAKKKCRIHIKQMKSRSDVGGCVPKNVGFTEVDLSKYTNAIHPFPLELSLSACSVPEAVLNVSVSSVQLETQPPSPRCGAEDLSTVFSDTASVTSYQFSDMSSLAPESEMGDFALEMAAPVELTAKNLTQFNEFHPTTPERSPLFPSAAEMDRRRVILRRFSSPTSNNQLKRQQSWSNGAEAQVFGLRIEALTKDVEFLRAENEFLRHKAEANQSDNFFHSQHGLVMVEELERSRAQVKLLEQQLALEKRAHVDTRKSFQTELRSARCQADNHTENQLEERLQTERMQQRRELELHRRIADLETSFDDLATTHRKLRRANDESKTALSGSRREYALIEDQLRETTKKYKGCLETLKASKNRLRKRVAIQQSQIDDLEATLLMVRNSWSDTAQLMEKQISDLQEELDDTKVRLAIAEDNKRQMEAEVAPIRNHAERLQIRREKTEDKLLQHEMVLAKQTVELTTLRTQLLAARGDNDHLQRTLARLTPQNTNVHVVHDLNGKASSVATPTRKSGRGTTLVQMSPARSSSMIDLSPKSLTSCPLFKVNGSIASRSSSASSVSRLESTDLHKHAITPRASFSSATTSRSGSLVSITGSSHSDSGAPPSLSSTSSMTPPVQKQKILRASRRDLLSTYSSSSSVDKSETSARALQDLHEVDDDRLSDLSGDEAEDMVDVD